MKIPKYWTFNSDAVAENFNEHVREQLPWYEMVTQAVSHIGRHYIERGGLVYDIGASTGNISRALESVIADRGASLVAIDNSEKMIENYKGIGEAVVADACDYEFSKFDFCVCFLTLMFVEPSRRVDFVGGLRSKIKTGGALVIVDKCLPASGYPAIILSRLALAEKMQNGVPAAQIIEKELSLSGVQRPIDVSILGDAVEFFRFGDFAGWIVEG